MHLQHRVGAASSSRRAFGDTDIPWRLGWELFAGRCTALSMACHLHPEPSPSPCTQPNHSFSGR